MPESRSPVVMEKLKIVIILVLVVLLSGMLYRTFSTPGKPQTNAPPANPATAPEAPLSTLTRMPKHTAKKPLRHWPNQMLAEILKHDPFSTTTQKLAEGNQPPTAGRQGAAVAGQLQQRPSPVPRFTNKVPEMMFHSRYGTMAVIDSQVVREGEILPNGTRVVEIRPDKIILERPDAG